MRSHVPFAQNSYNLLNNTNDHRNLPFLVIYVRMDAFKLMSTLIGRQRYYLSLFRQRYSNIIEISYVSPNPNPNLPYLPYLLNLNLNLTSPTLDNPNLKPKP